MRSSKHDLKGNVEGRYKRTTPLLSLVVSSKYIRLSLSLSFFLFFSSFLGSYFLDRSIQAPLLDQLHNCTTLWYVHKNADYIANDTRR